MFRRILIAGCFSMVAAPSFGTAIAFTTEASWLAATTPTHFDGFEDEALTGSSTLSTTNFDVSISPLSGGTSTAYISNALGWASEGTHILSGGGDPWRMDFVFRLPVYAAGFDVMSASETPTQSGATSYVIFGLASGEQFVMSSCPPCLASPGFPGNADYFFGIVSDTPFSTFSITNTAYSDGVGFDRVQLAAVPIPSAVWLFGCAIALLGRLRQRMCRRVCF
jgi:hypothetical protein